MVGMKLTRETGTATLIQFIVIALLNILTALSSILSTCFHPGGDCLNNIFSSVVYYIFIVIWFAALMVLGYAVQDKRSKRLAFVLICAEGLVVLVAAYSVKLDISYHNGVLGLITSAADVIMSGWVVVLTYRVWKAGGRRVVASHRARARRRPTQPVI
jgi:hypothetical protein